MNCYVGSLELFLQGVHFVNADWYYRSGGAETHKGVCVLSKLQSFAKI